MKVKSFQSKRYSSGVSPTGIGFGGTVGGALGGAASLANSLPDIIGTAMKSAASNAGIHEGVSASAITSALADKAGGALHSGGQGMAVGVTKLVDEAAASAATLATKAGVIGCVVGFAAGAALTYGGYKLHQHLKNKSIDSDEYLYDYL